MVFPLLVVIDQFNFKGVVVKPKHNPPIGPYCYGPEALQLALKRMQPIAGKVKGLRRFGSIKNSQNFLNGVHQIAPYSSGVPVFVESFQTPVLKAPDH
jgi:hypothetical protein